MFQKQLTVMREIVCFTLFKTPRLTPKAAPISLLVIVLCGGFGPFGTLRADSSSLNESTILVLGDSLSSAYGMSSELGWVSLLTQRLNTRLVGASSVESGKENSLDKDANVTTANQNNANKQWLVVNASVPGDTATSGAVRIEPLLDRHRPAVVIVELGGNDGLRGTPVDTIEKALSTILNAVKKADADAVLVGMRMPPNYGPRYVEQFDAVYRSLAAEHKVGLVPFLLDGIATTDGMMQADRIHPTAAAQPTMLDTVWTVLEPLLQ